MILCTNPQLGEIWDTLLDLNSDLSTAAAFAAMTRRQQVFYLVFWLDCELQNGGIGQFIRNYSGDLYHETIDALVAVGSIRDAAYMSYVEDGLGVTLLKDHDARGMQFDGMDISEFDKIDEQAALRVRADYGDWEPEEDEIKLLAFVNRAPLF